MDYDLFDDYDEDDDWGDPFDGLEFDFPEEMQDPFDDDDVDEEDTDFVDLH